ncbi:hypothetical protein GK047_11535 [Paenibacillus sp. SYP-B3998]|uniref:Uncharacterized protein n=1 Tax=Paenibacillus sp. SYP-B3998 TaxID=2678564 RepID=A0A6G3ZWP9_9BACL|nr:hypothetical protein [Paenibacillus sp. SYP-B3998]NEW06646.1 hypothetical protein [Paenibacillus sp. SYP-B3998]
MSTSIYYFVFSILLILAVALTIMIANSKQNREGNPEYDNKTKGNWSRLTIFYGLALALGILALILYIVRVT